jgi:hypothetical protein
MGGVVFTAVKAPVLTGVKPAGAGVDVAGGLDTPLSSLPDKGLSWMRPTSDAAPGGGDR